MPGEALVIMTKMPEPGRVKTRLGLPATDTVRLYSAFVGDLVERHRGSDYDLAVAVEPAEAQGRFSSLFPGCATIGQRGRDLGERIQGVFRSMLQEYAKIAVIGSDAPQLGAELVHAAFRALDSHDVAIGPAWDGGYYLIAMSREIPLFKGIEWSGPKVLSGTLESARGSGASVFQLPVLRDIDTLDDLKACRADLSTPTTPRTRDEILRLEKAGFLNGSSGRVSVVIPTLNEVASIGRTLEALPGDVEIIVADGGSTDGTPELARARAFVVTAPRGRAMQMNAGARSASGDVLLFLHADTRLPENGFREIRRAVDRGYVGGGFVGRFDSQDLRLRLGYTYRDLRTRFLKELYGDQGIFVRRDVFDALGGYRAIPIMEDYDFARRLRRMGRVRIVPSPVLTSPRRYIRSGIFRQHMKNFWIRQRFLWGADPFELARSYDTIRQDSLFVGGEP